MTGGLPQPLLEQAGISPCAAMAEIEIRLENILASVREIAARAEEHLRDAMLATAHGAHAHGAHAISHIPFVIEASRLQISAIHSLMAQSEHDRSYTSQLQRLAA